MLDHTFCLFINKQITDFVGGVNMTIEQETIIIQNGDFVLETDPLYDDLDSMRSADELLDADGLDDFEEAFIRGYEEAWI